MLCLLFIRIPNKMKIFQLRGDRSEESTEKCLNSEQMCFYKLIYEKNIQNSKSSWFCYFIYFFEYFLVRSCFSSFFLLFFVSLRISFSYSLFNVRPFIHSAHSGWIFQRIGKWCAFMLNWTWFGRVWAKYATFSRSRP